ncbi:MAG: hypothetical protein ABW136_08755 [Steroidobacteraceae bacterium]
MANDPAASRNVYSGGELAALLQLLLPNLNINLEPFDSLGSQLELAEHDGRGVPFHLAITAIRELYRTKPHVVDALQSSVRAAIKELDATGLWKADKFVAPVTVKGLVASKG